MTTPPAPYRPHHEPAPAFAVPPGPHGQPVPAQHAHPGPPPAHPPQFGPAVHGGAPRTRGANGVRGLGLASVVAVVAGLSIPEDGATGWDTVHAWGGLAILGALLTLAPVALSSLTATRAWQASVCGAGALVLFWVLFVLPAAGSNTSLVATIGVATGVIATWIAPGREPVGDRPSRTTW